MAVSMPEAPGVREPVLVVNADDFGRSPGVNRGVIKAHTDGIVTSATLMVRWPAAEEATAYARRSSLSLGFHLDLGDWQWRDGQSLALYEVLEEESPEAVAEEIERQLARFERLTGRSPTHLDSHQHVHRQEPVRSALLRAGERLSVPVRDLTPGIAYSGEFYGQYGKGISYPEGITVEALVNVIENLPPGITELGCHPASPADHATSYDREREQEVATLCDPRVRDTIDRRGVALRSFADLATGKPGYLTRP
jgi:predicted glycoside hydrolase/deacetylase ChbG (UPF0249 family)